MRNYVKLFMVIGLVSSMANCAMVEDDHRIYEQEALGNCIMADHEYSFDDQQVVESYSLKGEILCEELAFNEDVVLKN